LIEKIVVGEKAEKYSRTAPQDIWICYRDIGMLNDVNADFAIRPIEELYDDAFEIVFAEDLPQAI
jgi:site-specific DNA recombinase